VVPGAMFYFCCSVGILPGTTNNFPDFVSEPCLFSSVKEQVLNQRLGSGGTNRSGSSVGVYRD
jgi:hypothetical protein